jgi:hypothetical protein
MPYYSFAIEPETFYPFTSEEEQVNQCKLWGLLSDKATKTKEFVYKGHQVHLNCSIIGYVDPITAVISFGNGQLHCIHPAYLKEMQAASFSQKQHAVPDLEPVDAKPADDEHAESRPGELETETPPVPVHAAKDEDALRADIPGDAVNASKTINAGIAVEADKSGKAVKSKKLALPEEKVKMTAIVKAFATVPNHFAETEDEVVIYDAVRLFEPGSPDAAIEVGLAWSSHSATLKKLALSIGDELRFEAKIIAKKLTRHPVPYKINNPTKIEKVTG